MSDKKPSRKTENIPSTEYAIQADGISKTFRIPHEKITTIRGTFVSALGMKERGYFCGNINKIATLDKFSVFAIIDAAKTTRYDPLGMAGFYF
jgi:hypothetical protein